MAGTLEAGWVSRDLVSPVTPLVINGVVFAVSSGEVRTRDAKMTAAQRAQKSVPAVLYALDAATVRNSGAAAGHHVVYARRRHLGRFGPGLSGDARWHAVVVRLPDRTLNWDYEFIERVEGIIVGQVGNLRGGWLPPQCRHDCECGRVANPPQAASLPHEVAALIGIVAACGAWAQECLVRLRRSGSAYSVMNIERSIAPRQNRAGWQATMDKMISLGAKGTQKEFDAIVDYLAATYPAEEVPKIKVNEAGRLNWKAGCRCRVRRRRQLCSTGPRMATSNRSKI